jgi:hypothetical protein
MTTTEPFSALTMYGNKEIFARRLKEGFTDCTVGSGSWVGNKRIVQLFVFYHPDGRIATYEHPKYMGVDQHTYRGLPFEAEYTKETFVKHQTEFSLWISEGLSKLEELLKEWNE